MATNELYERNGFFKLCFTCKKSCKAHGGTLSVICPKYEEDQYLLSQPLVIFGNKPTNRNRQIRKVIEHLKELNLE